MQYRHLQSDEISQGIALVQQVFANSVQNKLSSEAVSSFENFLDDHSQELIWLGAFDDTLKGIAAYTPETYHVSLLFVRQEDSHQGIGTGLLSYIKKEAGDDYVQKITVNALLSSAAFYQTCGFEKAGVPTDAGGMQVQLMECLLGSRYLGRKYTVEIDQPYGSLHPYLPDLELACNAGYILLHGRNKQEIWQDACVYGPQEPLATFTGIVIGIIYRRDEEKTRWILSSGIQYDHQDVIAAIAGLEQDSDIRIQWL
ncbi:MAG: GNAT family N-acetyltransferase [Lactimicrobium sp.]|jgi:GNAT superfamily N-acetyltransferase|uniref:GNAT family N-acetyltransferase n=1 Tax=Lactimicrobium sp. TaxID=2563780 RepID=UPI002F359225